MAAAGTFRSLRVRNFRLFFGGQLISQVGNWMTLLTQTLYVLHRTNSGLAVGALTATQFLPVLLIGPWAGLVADRSDKRALLFRVQVFAMVQSVALAGFAFWTGAPIVIIYGIALAGGVATAFDNPARRSFVVEMVEPAEVTNAASLNSAMMTGARVVGPALAGLVIATLGYGWSFGIDAVSYVAVLWALKAMRPDELRPAFPTVKAKGQVRAGLAYAWATPSLKLPLLMMALVGTLSFNMNVVMPLFVKRSLSGSTTQVTLLFSVLSLGSLCGALYSARRTTTTVRLVALAAMSFGVTMAAMAFMPTLLLAFPLAFGVGLTSITFMTVSTAIMQTEADPSMRGRVLALQAMVFLGSTPIGGPLVGAVCDRFGARAGVALGGAAALVAGVCGLAALARTERAGQRSSALSTA